MYGFDPIFTNSSKIRLFWIIACIVSLGICGSMVHNIWTQWQENPVQMSFTEKESSIAMIPFPTITICHFLKTLKDDKQRSDLIKPFDISLAINSLSNLSDYE